MVTPEEVAELARRLPGTEPGEQRRSGLPSWGVAGKVYAWRRPFSKADLKRFGAAEPPSGPILAVVVEDLHEKQALLAEGRPGFFTIPHFDGYAAVLVALDDARLSDVEEALVGGWLARAPAALAQEYLDGSAPS